MKRLDQRSESSDSELCWITPTGQVRELPRWARWFIDLGASHANSVVSSGQREWTIVTVPDRRFAAALTAHGTVTTMVRSIESPPVADRFASSSPGDFLTWIDSNGESRFGRFTGIDNEFIHYRRRDHGGWGVPTARTIDMATTFWPAEEEDAFVGGRPLAHDYSFAVSAMGVPAERFLATSRVDVVIVGVRTDLEIDLADRCFSSQGHTGALVDTVRAREAVALGQHHRSSIVSAAADPDTFDELGHVGPTIFDGPAAYLRLRDELAAPTNIVILDRWNPRSEDAANTALIERNQMFIEAEPIPIAPPPAAVELFRWTEEL